MPKSKPDTPTIEPGRLYRMPDHDERFRVEQVRDNVTVLYRPESVDLLHPLVLPLVAFEAQFQPVKDGDSA